jgi:uncharacterized membrane protein YhaH (DUF805 family)
MDNWYFVAFKKYADFSGRASRSEYWYFTLINLLVTILLLMMINLFQDSENLTMVFGAIYILYGFAVFIPSLAVAVRRLHDVGKSGWFILISFLFFPYILYLYLKDSDTGKNMYGDNPEEYTPISEYDPSYVSQGFSTPSGHTEMFEQKDHTEMFPMPVGEVYPIGTLKFNNGIEEIILNVDSKLIGRSKQCNIVIDNQYVSGEHCRIEVQNGQVTITDLSSTNGTYMGPTKLTPNMAYTLSENEDILLGSGEISFKLVIERKKIKWVK